MVNSTPLIRVFLRYYPPLGDIGDWEGAEIKRGPLLDPVRSPWSDWRKRRLGAEQPIVNYGIPGAYKDLDNQQVCHNKGN